MANFQYHTAPITSIEWSTFDSTTLAATSADDQARHAGRLSPPAAARTAEPPASLPSTAHGRLSERLHCQLCVRCSVHHGQGAQAQR